jgi:protein SCO1/2
MKRFYVLVLATLLIALVSSLAPAAEEPAVSANPSLAVIGEAPDFILFDTSGKRIRLSDYRGRVVVVAFIFTSCPGVCPLISKQMSALQTGLKNEDLFGVKAGMLSITVDPETDTPEVLTEYAAGYGADENGWKFLYDEPAKMKPVYRAYDEWTSKTGAEPLDHPARVYLVDANGNIREIYSLAFFNEKQVLLDIKALLRDQS